MNTHASTPQIILEPAALAAAQRTQPAILPLESALASASAHWLAPVYWVSLTDPRQLLGALLEQFQGAYAAGPRTARVLVDQRQVDYPLPERWQSLPPARAQRLLARVLQWHLAGLSPRLILAQLNPSHQTQVLEAA